MPERGKFKSLVAEVAGVVAGDAQAGLSFFGSGETGFVSVRVDPNHTGAGIGSALYDAMLEHACSLDVQSLSSTFDENPRGVAFARARGWHESRAELWSTVDPRTVAAQIDSSVDLVPAGELDTRELHHVDEETTRDVPLHEPIEAIPYEEWLDFVWRSPTFTKEGSFGALVDGRLAAVTFLLVDPVLRRGTNMFTGTLREFRGRGLALATKLASLQWAAANGITQIATINDETNAAMLAVNRRLGYRPAGRRVEYVTNPANLLRLAEPGS